MPKEKIHEVSYEFSDAEITGAKLLTSLNVQFLLTQIHLTRQLRFNLTPDPNNYPAFIQQESELKGAESAYQFLLDQHEEALTSVSHNSRNQES